MTDEQRYLGTFLLAMLDAGLAPAKIREALRFYMYGRKRKRTADALGKLP